MVALLASCKDDPVAVTAGTGTASEHGRAALIAAVTELGVARHTPAAFARFRDRVLALRPTMDDTVAEEAERLAVTQAVEVARQVPGAAGGAAPLVLTVWPLALAPELEAPEPGHPDADPYQPWLPLAGEDEASYLERLCGDLLALECKGVVPEGHAALVAGQAISRMTERARRAVSLCLTCSDDAWKASIAGWEALDSQAITAATAARTRYAPARWPLAGEAAGPPADGPLLKATDEGALELGAEVIVPDSEAEAIALLQTARGTTTILRLHLPPRMAADRVRRIQQLAGRAGFAQIALVARAPAYPFATRDYRLGVKDALPVRDADPLQILLRVLDARVRKAPATVKDGAARVPSADRRR